MKLNHRLNDTAETDAEVVGQIVASLVFRDALNTGN